MRFFTGKAFRSQGASSTDTTWCIGCAENGEKERISADLSLATNDDCFILRQPKFEIVTPPAAVLRDRPVTSTTVQTAQVIPTHGMDAAVRVDLPRTPIQRTRPAQRKPLPREPSALSEDGEGYVRSSSSSYRSSIRRLPPIPQSPRPAALPSVVEEREILPPSYRSVTTHSRRYSVLRSIPSHSHSGSLDSVASDVSLMSGSTQF